MKFMKPATPETHGVYLDWGNSVGSVEDDAMFDDIAKACRVPVDTIKKIWKSVGNEIQRGTHSEDDFWTAYVRETKKAAPAGGDDLFTRAYQQHSRLNTGVRDIILHLREKGYRVGLLSNTIPSHVDYFRANPQRSLYDLFDPLIASCEQGSRKSDIGHPLYLRAEKLMERPNIVFCDDIDKYAVDAVNELNQRPNPLSRWVGVHASEFDKVATVLEKKLRAEGFDF